MGHAPDHLKQKMKRILRVSLFALGIILTRLIYLQINLSDYFSIKSKKNFQRTAKIQPLRGNILDCKNRMLATNRPVTDLYWQGTGNRRLSQAQKNILEQITSIIDINDKEKLPATIRNAERYHKQTPLFFDLTFDQISKLEELFPNNKNITLQTRFARYYPYKSYASHILGYLGDINIAMRGKMGLELLFQEQLQGEHGIVLRTINSLGKKLAEHEIKESLVGNNIQTTLDINLQHICEEVFPQNYSGTMIVMNPHDGAIKAIISRPSFDPSLFLAPISLKEWHAMQEKKPFINRAFNATYPPGSIFKLIVVSAALEQGVIKPESTWNCEGSLVFGKRKYWCHRRYGHGEINTAQAVAKSCNILFYEIGKRMDIDQIAHYAGLFGLGEKTGIIFSEKKGIIPTRLWKEETIGERWWAGETLSIAIGQSFLTVTPIQIACMISSIFTHSLTTPRMLKDEPIQKRPLNIKHETLEFLQNSMAAVVTKGTGQRVSRVKDIKIYAKTSTAQVSSLKKRNIDNTHLEHGWFVAYFKYKEHKPLTIIILIEHAGSSRMPTMAAKHFLIRYKKYKDALT